MPTLIASLLVSVVKHWKIILIFVLGLIISGFIYKAHKWQTKYENLSKAHVQLIIDSELAAKELEIGWQVKLNEAERKFNEQVSQLNADKSALVDRANGLSKQLDKAQSRWATAPPESRTEYTNALSNVFKECVSEYKDLAIKADGHALDALRLKEAWPTNDKPP